MLVGQSLQTVSPGIANCVAEQFEHTMSLVTVQKLPESCTEPAAHCVLQFLQGSKPFELHVREAVQGSTHALVAAFHP